LAGLPSRINVVGSSDEAPNTLASLEPRLDATLAELLAAGAPGALALAVGPWGRSYSAAGLDSSGHPLPATARFDVGSITKTFVAALTLVLVEDGKLWLDDEARAHLPARFEQIGSVTVRSLLNHTSGLPDFFEDAAFVARWQENPSRAWDPDELIELSLGLARQEAGVFSYSNSNYVLIGLMIESLAGCTVDELLRRRILEPRELSATRLPAAATAAGGLVSTSDDLAHFFAALLAGEIVGESLLREMLTTVPCDWAESQGYGLGIEQVESMMGFEVSPCGAAWGHIGLGRDTTVAFITPDASRQVVLMTNAFLTSDAAWAALSRATWAVLCPDTPSRL
jgi:D-alanyl-D-alanine carboxypeptidase